MQQQDRRSGSAFGRVLRRHLYALADGRCGLCGYPIDENNFVVDHILPVSEGGTSEPDNLQIAHPSCNAYKGGTNQNSHGSSWPERVKQIRETGRVRYLILERFTHGHPEWSIRVSTQGPPPGEYKLLATVSSLREVGAILNPLETARGYHIAQLKWYGALRFLDLLKHMRCRFCGQIGALHREWKCPENR